MRSDFQQAQIEIFARIQSDTKFAPMFVVNDQGYEPQNPAAREVVTRIAEIDSAPEEIAGNLTDLFCMANNASPVITTILGSKPTTIKSDPADVLTALEETCRNTKKVTIQLTKRPVLKSQNTPRI